MATCLSYVDNFWDSEITCTTGFDVLVRRMKDGRKFCKDMDDYYRQRSKIESQYAKDLQKLIRSMEKRAEIGVLEESWNSLRNQTEVMAHHHETASNNFCALANEAEKLKESLKLRAKQTEDRTARAHNVVKTSYQRLNNLLKTYEQKSAEYCLIQHDSKYLDPADQKTAQKFKNKESKARDEMEKSDGLYHSAVDNLQSVQRNWEEDMRNCSQVFQDLDEERIYVLRDVMWKGTNVDSQLCVDLDGCSEDIRLSLEFCDIETDIAAFVQASKTGSMPPAIITYQNYFKNSGHTSRTLPPKPTLVPKPSRASKDKESIYATVD